MKVYLTAILKSKPGSVEALKPLLFNLVAQSTQEEACLQYELYQSAEDENMFIFHETWFDQAGLDVHNSGEGINTFVTAAGPILDGPIIIYKTNKISE